MYVLYVFVLLAGGVEPVQYKVMDGFTSRKQCMIAADREIALIKNAAKTDVLITTNCALVLASK